MAKRGAVPKDPESTKWTPQKETVPEWAKSGFQHPWMPRFISNYRDTGIVRLAAAAAGIGRQWAYECRKTDPVFAKAWEEAEADAIEALEAEAKRRAYNGSDTLLIFMLKASAPDKYREKVTVITEDSIDAELNRLAAELARRPGREEISEA